MNMAAMPQARLASLAAQLVPGSKAVRLLPAGEFRAADGSGRPTDAPHWRVDGEIAAALIAQHAARQSRRVVDYEHQTLRAASNGKPAPAAGWIDGLEWREGDGLYATVEWTESAAAMIAAGEYRYLSPVFPYDATGRVLDIRHAALTNDPGLDGLTDLAALSALMANPETPMLEDLMERLRYLLNVPLTTTPEEMGEHLDKLKAMVTASGAASLTAWMEAKDANIAALTAAAPDPAKYAPVETMAALQAQVAALTADKSGREVDALVQAGLADGRILPAMEGWARELGQTNQAALTAYLEKAPKVAALQGTQTGGDEPAGAGAGVTGLSETQLAVCQNMGVDPAQFLATLKAV